MDKNEDGQSAYSLEWTSSALDVDKRGKRHKFPVVIEVQIIHIQLFQRVLLTLKACLHRAKAF